MIVMAGNSLVTATARLGQVIRVGMETWPEPDNVWVSPEMMVRTSQYANQPTGVVSRLLPL